VGGPSGRTPARRADVGGAAAGSAAGSAQLGRNAGAPGTRLGCASSRCAHGAAAAASRASATTATITGRGPAACADLGIASSGVRAGCTCARSVVGFRSAGCAGAQPSVNRLGSGRSQLAAHGATGAVLERACRGVFVGRAQERGAGGSCSAVMGCALERAPGIAGLVGAFAG
jgi:hypothetical protein